jgi:hypothetical protein
MDIIGDNGLSQVKGVLYPGLATPAAPNGAVLIGVDAAGNNWCYVQRLQEPSVILSNANINNSTEVIAYSVSTGSTIGFSQTFGVTVEASASISFFVEVSAKVQLKADIGFTQAFSSLKTVSLTVNSEPGLVTTIYQGAIVMDYYKLANIWTGTQNYCYQEWQKAKTDVVETPAFATVTSPLPTESELKAMV